MSDGPFTVTVSAPAKVNLTLDVFPQRADGFHDLDSLVVCFRTPADSLTVSVRPGGGAATPVTLIVKHASEGVPKGPENLAHAAVLRYLTAYPGASVSRVFVKLDKRIPLQAGLGGGSSDAAAVLLALDELVGSLPEGASPPGLTTIAAALGSDVPLFLRRGAPVRMRGRGDIVESLNVHLPKLWGAIVKPAEGVPTGAAYSALDALPDRAPGSATPRLLAALRERGDARAIAAEDIAPLLANDFEAAILPAYTGVAEAHAALHRAGALRALLCGSGAAVFGLATDREHARALVRALVGRFPYVHLAETIATGEMETAR